MSETLIKLTKEIGKIPELKNALICDINKNETTTHISIEGIWSFKNYSDNERNTLRSLYIYDTKENQIHSLSPTLEDKRIILSATAPCGSRSAYLLQNDDCCYLNVISDGEQAISINLKDEDVHGIVYKDETLASFCWSPDSNLLAFIAEKKRPKPSNFLSKKSESNNEGWGEKYAYINDWGEQMNGYHQSVAVIVDTTSEEIKVLDLPEGLCGGQVVWTPEGNLVGVAFVTEPYRLGLIYCPNRESVLFHLDLKGDFSELTEKGSHVQSPRFSPDGSNLIFLRSPVGGPHVRSAQLCLIKWKERETTILIDYVDKEQKLADNNSFYGLCGRSILPLRCWSKDSRDIVFSALNNFARGTYVINTEKKEIRQLSSKSSLVVHDVREDYILASLSSLTEPTRIALIPLYSHAQEENITFISRANTVEGIAKEWQYQWTFQNPNPHPKELVSDSPVPAIYFGPTETQPGGAKRPLIVWLHGGPHSMIENTFIPSASFFVGLGYSILFPNYRGSLGQGRNALESLSGNCGTTDVDDSYQATILCLERFKSVLDESRVVLFGGSHGGFLVTHLSAQHPELYKVVAARNPVTDIATMACGTDIPDWTFVECGIDYNIGKCVNGKIFSRMFEASPLNLVDKVKAPTLLLLGKEDRRVPHSQGLFYYKMLLARKIPAKTYVYDDCHPLRKVDVEVDCLIQTVLWYQKHL